MLKYISTTLVLGLIGILALVWGAACMVSRLYDLHPKNWHRQKRRP